MHHTQAKLQIAGLDIAEQQNDSLFFNFHFSKRNNQELETSGVVHMLLGGNQQLEASGVVHILLAG